MDASGTKARGDLYHILKVSSFADAAEIRKAYRRAALLAHPDKGGTSDAFLSTNFAFQVLSCPIARQRYDQGRQTVPADAMDSSRQSSTMTRGVKRRGVHCTVGPSKRLRSMESGATSGKARLDAGLECLRAILQAMPAQQRRKAALNATPTVRQALLAFMQHPRAAADAARCERRRPPRSEPSQHPADGATGHVTSVRRNGTPYHQARVYVNSLCLYTRVQAKLETAIEHQIVLLEIRRSLIAAASADSHLWGDPFLMRRACGDALTASGVSEAELGLRACVMLRAVRWIGPRYRIVTTSSSLRDALDSHVRLITARTTSWEVFRAEWLRHLAKSKTYGRTGDGKRPRIRRHLSAEEAEDFVDAARRKSLDEQLSRAGRHVEHLLKFAKKSQVRKRAKQNCQACGGG